MVDHCAELTQRTELQAQRANEADRKLAGDAELQVVVETSAVIVGSGAGGCVAAGVLAAARCTVVVLDKGPYVHPEAIPDDDATAIQRAYEAGGLCAAEDSGASLT